VCAVLLSLPSPSFHSAFLCFGLIRLPPCPPPCPSPRLTRLLSRPRALPLAHITLPQSVHLSVCV
jgi:hypothetical protein